MEEKSSTSGSRKRSIPKELQDKMDETAAKLPRVTATPAVLDDNQKRYLVVGTCLHSIISPALRKYVLPILTALYDELILKQKIDTQTYTARLKQYQPTKAYLYYEAVNNNKAVYGKQFEKYDYTIKSVVDFSKLFLQPHMAQYTGFDETCDSSAVLGLIISIDKFPVAVKSDAKDVRDKVRNQWAHCDFTKWDAVKYADSFRLMTNLVKNLSMSSTDESQTLLEMEKWEINGPSSLNDTNEICRLLHVLVESLKHVVKETDNTSLEIKRLLDKVEHQGTLLDHQKGEIEFWQEASFVDTPVVNVISEIMESENSVLIIGEPGIGKSMLMQNVALKVQKNNDYNIIPCIGIQDILQHYKKDDFQMFVLDDICGRFTVSMSKIDHWMDNEEKLKRILKKGKTKVVATCRLDIYNDEKFKEAYSVFKSNIFNLSERYTREDKIKICRNYLSEAEIQLVQEQNVDFTPLMCYLHSKNQSFNLTDFLECPFKTYQEEWEKFKALYPDKYCSLFLCVIYNGIMTESLFDLYIENSTKNRQVWENIFEICGINRGTSRSKIQSALDSMIGTYMLKKRNEYRVIHDQLFDFMCSYFGKKDTMVQCILRYANIRVFNQRTQIGNDDEQVCKFTIMIAERYEMEYFGRIKSDIQLGKLNHCFYNTQMKYKAYRTSIIKILKSIDDEVLIPQIYQKPKNPSYGRHTDYFFETEGPLIKSCLRGYYDICQYFISKNVDLKKCESKYTPLTAACEGGDERTVQVFLDKGGDVNKVDEWGYTPLSAACSKGNEKIVQLLLDKGSDVNKVGSGSCTPLTAACNGGYENIVQLLLNKGSDVNLFDGIKLTPLTAACSEENENIVQLLINKESDVNKVDGYDQTPLTAACEGGNEKIVQLLIDKGGDVNKVGRYHQTPLTAACERGNEKIVQLLLDRGSDVNKVRRNGKTPLTAACERGNKNIVQLLLDRGSDVNQVDGKEQTPLTAACLKGNEKIVQSLIDKGSDVNMVGRYDQTPLTAACEGGNEKIVKLLIDEGSDVNKVWRNNKTPLTTACIGGNEKIVELLIDRGSDAKLMDGRRHTPLAISCRQNNEKLVRFFIDKGSDVNTVDVFNQTPLTIACEGGNEKIVQLLIANGSDINQVNDKENTALTMACKYRNEKIVQVLIDNGSLVNQVDGLGMTPLTVACSGKNENERMFEEQHEKYYGKRVDDMIHAHIMHMTRSCSGGDEKIVQLLVDKGSNVNQADCMGVTPLTAACKGENEKIVHILIDNGSDVNQVDKTKRTPLAIARLGKNKKIVQLLIDKEIQDLILVNLKREQTFPESNNGTKYKEKTENLSRKRLPDKSTQWSVGPSKVPTVTDHRYSNTGTALLYGRYGMIPKTENNEKDKEVFYKFNIVCDSFVVDCIIDRKLERKCSRTVKEFNECKEEMKQWNESQLDFFEKVNNKFQNFVEKQKSCLCQYLLNTLLLKHTSNNAIETDILVNALYSSIENDDVDTAKFIGWQIARNFLKSLNVPVYDIWLATLCSCSRLRKKHVSWFCSSNVTICIMVPHLIMENVNIFSGLPVRQIVYHCETFKEAQAISEERAKLLEKDLNIQCHVPGPLAEKLFNNHRKLALVCPSEIKSINFQDFPTMPTFRNCSCIQLFCHVKGAIPIGEKHFPSEIQGIQTDVIEGFPRFSSKHIRICDSVTNTKVKGTLGGFCRFYGREAFLTCAHTMIDWDTLRSEESKHHMQLESVNLYTGDKILDETLLCGKVVNHSFTYDNSGDTSTDVALIEICDGISVSEDDYIKTKQNEYHHYAKLGLKSRYLNDGNYIRSLDDLLGRTVEVVCAGATSGLNSSVSLISKVPQRILAQEDLQSASTSLETRCMEYLQTQVKMHVHMQLQTERTIVRAIIHESRKEEAESNRTVRFYKQLAVNKIPFQQGDSGACVYITNGYKETGCLGMAIADFPGGGCIVTPMVKLLQKLNIIKPSF